MAAKDKAKISVDARETHVAHGGGVNSHYLLVNVFGNCFARVRDRFTGPVVCAPTRRDAQPRRKWRA
jgi:hypothetical protein